MMRSRPSSVRMLLSDRSDCWEDSRHVGREAVSAVSMGRREGPGEFEKQLAADSKDQSVP